MVVICVMCKPMIQTILSEEKQENYYEIILKILILFLLKIDYDLKLSKLICLNNKKCP